MNMPNTNKEILSVVPDPKTPSDVIVVVLHIIFPAKLCIRQNEARKSNKESPKSNAWAHFKMR